MCEEQFLVHRVTAFSFLGPPPSEDAWQVHHKDGNPANNRVTNLEYVTGSQNLRYSFASGTRRRGGPTKPVVYRAVGSIEWTRCPSIKAAASELGVSRAAVSQACRRQTPLKGYELGVENLCQTTLRGEEWRPMLCPVSGVEVAGRMVSSLGRLRTHAGHVHSGYLRSGYPAARYTSLAGSRVEAVHRLVAVAFLGPPPSSQHTQVNHKDGDKKNNAVPNLEYVTPSENRAHYLENRTAEHRSKTRSDSKPVWSRAYGSNDEWAWHPSILSAAKALGVHSSSVSQCVRGNCHQAGGYEFRADIFQSLSGEIWKDVDVEALVNEKRTRMQAPFKPFA